MKIRILGWKYINIRKFKNVEVDLTKDSKKITLVMMRNGTGKTTTINLMRAVLSGNAEEWDSQQVCSFRPIGDEIDKGEFHLRVQYDDRVYYYILNLDYLFGKAYYQTSCYGQRGGLEQGCKFPYNLRGVINQEEFVNRFVFDGEQARKTLGAGNEEAERAIIYLYQINKLDNLIEDIKTIVKNKEAYSDKSYERSIKIYKGKLEKGEKLYNKLCDELRRLKKTIVSQQQKLYDLEKKYDDIISEDEKLREKQNKLKFEKEQKELELKTKMREILEHSKKPYNVNRLLDERLKWLSKNMQILKLPKATAREFFNELAESKKCICGRDIGSIEKQEILNNANKFLGRDELVVLNAVKHKLKEYEREEIISLKLNELNECVDELYGIGNDLERIAIEAASKVDDNVVQIKNEIQELKECIKQGQNRCEQLETKDFNSYPNLDENINIEKAKRYLENAKENYLRETKTYEFAKKAERVIRYIKEIKKETLNMLKRSILEATNEKIGKIITNDSITIEKIEGHLVIKDRDAVSEGQTLAIAYAYIGSLFEHSQIEFPFVVDSPAASMDLKVRREVATILPLLFNQLIVFVTSGEVAGFAETFYNYSDVRYLTIEETQTTPCVEGKEYFANYQIEEE